MWFSGSIREVFVHLTFSGQSLDTLHVDGTFGDDLESSEVREKEREREREREREKEREREREMEREGEGEKEK